MAIVSLDAASAGGAAVAATKMMAHNARLRLKCDFMCNYAVSHLGRFHGGAQDAETRSTRSVPPAADCEQSAGSPSYFGFLLLYDIILCMRSSCLATCE